MDIRLKFLNRQNALSPMERRRKIGEPGRWSCREGLIDGLVGKIRGSYTSRGHSSRKAKSLTLRCQENLLGSVRRPYRKPTQVDEERILRRSSNVLSRNSANYSRNFGKREASLACKREEVAEKWLRRLFNKNTALC